MAKVRMRGPQARSVRCLHRDFACLGRGWQPLIFSPLWRELPHRGDDAAIIGTRRPHLVLAHGDCLGDLATRMACTVGSPCLPYRNEQEVSARPGLRDEERT